MWYAVVEDRGKQYKVHEGDMLRIDLLRDAEEGRELSFKVVLASGEEGVKVGTPYVDSATVKAIVVEPLWKDKKVIAVRRIVKNDKKTRRGHRQKYTVVKVDSIMV